ncbi:unnamed protein product [Sphagnum balticum]
MRYVAAYLLALLGGNKAPSEADIKKILGSVGIEVDAEKAKTVIGQLSGKNIEEIIKKGSEKLASVPSGGAVAVASGGAAPAAAAGDSPKKEGKKEAKKEESEEEDEDMGFGLFD